MFHSAFFRGVATTPVHTKNGSWCQWSMMKSKLPGPRELHHSRLCPLKPLILTAPPRTVDKKATKSAMCSLPEAVILLLMATYLCPRATDPQQLSMPSAEGAVGWGSCPLKPPVCWHQCTWQCVCLNRADIFMKSLFLILVTYCLRAEKHINMADLEWELFGIPPPFLNESWDLHQPLSTYLTSYTLFL